MVGADTLKVREPNRGLVRGTWRSFDEEERRPLVGAYEPVKSPTTTIANNRG